MTYKRHNNISKKFSIFFNDTIQYTDIENDISIFTIYQIITTVQAHDSKTKRHTQKTKVAANIPWGRNDGHVFDR